MNAKYREPLVLKDHPTQHFPITNGVRLVLFGISLIIAGALIDLNALRFFSPAKDISDWIAGYFGGIVFVAGVISVVFGMRREARRARYLRQLALWPGHPWFYDFPWHPEGISFSSFGAVVSKLMAALIWSVPIPCFCYWVGSDTDGVVWMGLIMSLLMSLAFWIPLATTLSNFLCFGDSYLSYDSFPFFLGKQLAVRLRSPKLVRMDTLSFILRCIREQPVTVDGSLSTVCHEFYRDVVILGGNRLPQFRGGEIPVEFVLPIDQPSTSLISFPPVYWEIEVRGESLTASYHIRFLVPIYKALK